MQLKRIIHLVIVVCTVMGMLMVGTPTTHADSIPTTSNPTINTANGGVRTMQNVSFEDYGTVCPSKPTSYHVIRQEQLGGWYSTQPTNRERCSSVLQGTVSDLYRVVEIQAYGTFGRLYTPEDGEVFAELNAYVAGMLYQPMCMRNNETFEFSFAHRPTYGSDTDIAAFRIGIPSGLDAGSTAADAYDREIVRVTSVASGGVVTSVSQTAADGTTANTPSISANKWGIYSGTHTLPATGYSGIRNVGFYAIKGRNAGEGNLLDDIRLGLNPIIDLGTTRDQSGNEGTTPTAMNIRINGRVAAATTIVLEQNAGTATPDTDYSLGSVTADKFGAVTVTHTAGTSTWTITVPPGDYDGGIVAGSRAGGLTIPITYTADANQGEATEWATFNLKAPGAGGSSSNWLFDDPTCDGSFKSDGAVYTITNVVPTATPTPEGFVASPTSTRTPTTLVEATATKTPTTIVETTATKTPTTVATPAVQTISFPAFPEWHLSDGKEIPLTAVTNSGLPVLYATTTPLVCTIVAGKLMVVGVGKCTVKAYAAAGTNKAGVKYAESAEVQREFFITDPTPTVTSTPTNTRTYTPTLTPTPIPYMMKKGVIGASFVLGLLQNNTLVTWGMNREYQANIPPCCGAGIQDIAVGTNFALALKGGRVYGWGANTLQQINIPKTAQKDIVAIAAGGSFGLALNKKGGVVYWGNAKSTVKQVPKTLKKGVKLIAGGTDHALAVTTKNTVIGWGNGKQGQTKPPAKVLRKQIVTQVSAGLDHSLALLQTGTVVAWGNNSNGQAKVPVTAVDIKFISAGNRFSIALTNSGKVIGWGDNSVNQLDIPEEYTDIYTVAAGYANTIVGLRNGRIIVLGDQSNDVGVSRTPTKTATPTP
jgi:Regulator of chromosome condensation (RCC1) repeat